MIKRIGNTNLVLGSKSLAVTAPGGIELKENVLVVVHNNILVVLGDDDVDRAGLRGGDLLRLDAWGDLASSKVADELLDGSLADLLGLVEGELGVLGSFLDGESRPLLLEVEVGSVGTEGGSINGGKVDLALELLGNVGDSLNELLLVLVALLNEEVGKRNASGHVSLVGIGANLTNQWHRGDLDELGDLVLRELALVDGLGLVIVLVQDNGGSLDALLLGNSGIMGSTEEEVIAEILSNGGDGLVGGLVVTLEVGDDDNLVLGLELLDILRLEDGDGGKGLLDHERFNSSSLAGARVGGAGGRSTEHLESGVSLDFLLGAKVRLGSTVTVENSQPKFNSPSIMQIPLTPWQEGACAQRGLRQPAHIPEQGPCSVLISR